MPPCDSHSQTRQTTTSSFNPCFSGCRPATERRKQSFAGHHTVSILVLVDAALRPGIVEIRTWAYLVSILVLVDAALRLFSINGYRNRNGVSILVLVDAALRLTIYLECEASEIRFNPCFSGCRPATIPHFCV